jgi:rRNA maturation protein Rpf1
MNEHRRLGNETTAMRWMYRDLLGDIDHILMGCEFSIYEAIITISEWSDFGLKLTFYYIEKGLEILRLLHRSTIASDRLDRMTC